MRFIIYLSTLLFFSFSIAQDINEIISTNKKQLNETSNASEKAKIYADLSWYFLYVSIDSAETYGYKALKLAKEIKNDTLIAQAYNDLGNVFVYKGDFKKAQEVCFLSKKIRKELNDNEGVASINFKLGNNFNKLGDYDSSIYYFFKSLNYYESVENEEVINNLLSNISNTYYVMGNYDKALQYIEKPIIYFQQTEDYTRLSNTLLNLGSIYLKNEDTTTSLLTFKKAEKHAKHVNNIVALSSIYNNYASIYTSDEQYDTALFYIKKSIDLRKEMGLLSDLESSNLTYVISLFNTGDFKKAKPKALELQKAFEKSGYKDKLVQIYQLLAYMYAYEGDIDSLSFYNKRFTAIHKQLQNDKLLRNSQELEKKYQTEKKEKEILVQRAKLAEKNTYIIIVISLLIFTLLISFLIYIYLKQKNKQLKQENQLKDAFLKIETQNKLQEQRLQISRDLHDNIGAQLTFIISSIDNLKYTIQTPNPAFVEKLSNISGFTKDTIVELRDTIWAMNKEQISIEDLETRISNFIDNAKVSLSGIHFDFICNTNNNHVQAFSSKDGMNIYRIIQESVNNAIKHAQASKIVVQIDVFQNNMQISIKDNGIGIKSENHTDGNGLHSMKKRAGELNANFDITNLEKGTSVDLIINTDYHKKI